MSAKPPLLIGLDGGATSAKACLVEQRDEGLAAAGTEEEPYDHSEGFAPVQREGARKAAHTAAERMLAHAWVEAASRAVARLAAGRGPALIGAALAGLKTPDGRGLAWARNGPRIPDYLARLELELSSSGVELAAPIAGLFSDGDCCGAGEERAEAGLFRGVRNAWYAGGGTGLAEAVKLDGELVELDALPPDFSKAWELPWRAGLTFEDALSLKGLNARAGGPVEERLPTQAGQSALAQTIEALADLAARRVADLERAGRGRLERAVVGQRLGLLLATEACASARAQLAEQLASRGLPRSDWLVFSRLREAPALGAAARALDAWVAAQG